MLFISSLPSYEVLVSCLVIVSKFCLLLLLFFPSSTKELLISIYNVGPWIIVLINIRPHQVPQSCSDTTIISPFWNFIKMPNFPIFSQFWLLTSFSVLVSKSAQFLPNIQRMCMNDIITSGMYYGPPISSVILYQILNKIDEFTSNFEAQIPPG